MASQYLKYLVSYYILKCWSWKTCNINGYCLPNKMLKITQELFEASKQGLGMVSTTRNIDKDRQSIRQQEILCCRHYSRTLLEEPTKTLFFIVWCSKVLFSDYVIPAFLFQGKLRRSKTIHKAIGKTRKGLLVESLTRSLDYNPKRVSERVRSRPGHIQKHVNTNRVCRMRLKTVVPCSWASMPGQVKHPTQVDSSL
jgi:hypothetical protein